MTEIYL